MIKALFYLPLWYLKSVVFGRKSPLQTVIFITDRCNLKCRHCSQANHAGKNSKTFNKIRSELLLEYAAGARFVDFEGGEPTLWREGGYALNDLIKLSKEIGYYSATVTTNGQLPFDGCEADTLWVSLDGAGTAHDDIRGAGSFAALERNIQRSGHRRLCANMTVNRRNLGEVSRTVRRAAGNPAVFMISLNLHTPFPGTEELALSAAERGEIIEEIIGLKRQGYPIMNSVSGLRAMTCGDNSGACWVTSFVLADGTRLPRCPGSTLGLCPRCGFCMAGETKSALRLRPDTILSGLRLRMGRHRALQRSAAQPDDKIPAQ